MKRIGLLAILLSACTGTVYPYASSQPQYASSGVAQTTQSSDGTTTTTTTTSETATFEAYPAAQPAAYEAPPPADEPPPPPPPAGGDPRCDRKDTPDMCVALHVMLDVGAILKSSENASCRDTSRSLNRYADTHGRELDTFLGLESKLSRKQIEKFQRRHQSEATLVMGAAMDVDTRCEGDEKLDRALHRVGFHGMIGNAAM